MFSQKEWQFIECYKLLHAVLVLYILSISVQRMIVCLDEGTMNLIASLFFTFQCFSKSSK